MTTMDERSIKSDDYFWGKFEYFFFDLYSPRKKYSKFPQKEN